MVHSKNYRLRRVLGFLAILTGIGIWLVVNPDNYESQAAPSVPSETEGVPTASAILEKLEVKGRAPKTGYARTEFYNGWPNIDGCSLRQIIIKREVGDTAKMDGCDVVAGSFTEPYTGANFVAKEKSDFSKNIQIDHIVALSDAWQKGAQYMDKDTRYNIATDPLNLIAADSSANQQKSDGDAATWLPPNKSFRCQYVARQVSVKYKYHLWVSEAEHDAISNILSTCSDEPSVGISQLDDYSAASNE